MLPLLIQCSAYSTQTWIYRLVHTHTHTHWRSGVHRTKTDWEYFYCLWYICRNFASQYMLVITVFWQFVYENEEKYKLITKRPCITKKKCHYCGLDHRWVFAETSIYLLAEVLIFIVAVFCGVRHVQYLDLLTIKKFQFVTDGFKVVYENVNRPAKCLSWYLENRWCYVISSLNYWIQ